MQIKIISAGAGSGKTFRLTREMVGFLTSGKVRPEGIIATTFTRLAAAELQERARMKLLEEGLTREADALAHALIGTVHGTGVKLLRRFAYEAGVSPQVDIIPEEDHQVMFNQALALVLTGEKVERMEELSLRFGHDVRSGDWRKEVRQLTELARANAFDLSRLDDSRKRSWASMKSFLDPVEQTDPQAFNAELGRHLSDTITRLENNADTTKKTAGELDKLRRQQRELELHGSLTWPAWAWLGKVAPGANSRDDVADLIAFARSHTGHPGFHQDVKDYIDLLFGLAAEAILEYNDYKNRRGLIDYTDMESLVARLLDRPDVQDVLRDELDLLLVDEFQDTSPLQLEIFLKLSKLARYSVWVGDPKQSIYGFRGAEPALMRAVIQRLGGVRPEDIQAHSWRSRADISYATNAIFTRAFPDLPPEQVALAPRPGYAEDPDQAPAVWNWLIQFQGEGRKPDKRWNHRAIAEGLRQTLAEGNIRVAPKGEDATRPLLAGDVAILCRSNAECSDMAEMLADAGIKAALSRAGLLQTAEATLILACLKYLLNRRDSLSVAEILVLGSGWTTETMIEHRLAYLEGEPENPWAAETPIIRELDGLRQALTELSGSEMLDVILEELDLRRTIVAWGNVEQRLDNVECLRRMALEYESASARMHNAASLGGFLLWLTEQAADDKDKRGSGQAPDAVNVLTYHGSKGLEWPFVVCHSLDNSLRSDIWGLAIVAERDEIDLDAVLAHRWIRYWVNPYGQQYRRTPLDERLGESDAAKAREAEARQEETRLLYVGMTRARDYLVLANGLRGTPWLNRVCKGEENAPTLPQPGETGPWSWEGKPVELACRELSFPREFPSYDPPPETIRYGEPRPGKGTFESLYIDAAKEDLPVRVAAPRLVHYAKPFPVVEHSDPRYAGQMLKAYKTAFPEQASAEELKEMAEGHLARFLPREAIPAERLAESGHGFFAELGRRYPGRKLMRHYPLSGDFNGRRFEATADLLLIGDEDIVVMQHSSFSGTEQSCLRNTRKLAPWLALMRQSVEQVYGLPVLHTCLNYVLEGFWIETFPEGKAAE